MSGDDGTTSEQSEYDVEYLEWAELNTDDKSQWYYKVKWVGYSDDRSTLEPEEYLTQGSEDLLQSFWTHVSQGEKKHIPRNARKKPRDLKLYSAQDFMNGVRYMPSPEWKKHESDISKEPEGATTVESNHGRLSPKTSLVPTETLTLTAPHPGSSIDIPTALSAASLSEPLASIRMIPLKPLSVLKGEGAGVQKRKRIILSDDEEGREVPPRKVSKPRENLEPSPAQDNEASDRSVSTDDDPLFRDDGQSLSSPPLNQDSPINKSGDDEGVIADNFSVSSAEEPLAQTRMSNPSPPSAVMIIPAAQPKIDPHRGQKIKTLGLKTTTHIRPVTSASSAIAVPPRDTPNAPPITTNLPSSAVSPQTYQSSGSHPTLNHPQSRRRSIDASNSPLEPVSQVLDSANIDTSPAIVYPKAALGRRKGALDVTDTVNMSRISSTITSPIAGKSSSFVKNERPVPPKTKPSLSFAATKKWQGGLCLHTPSERLCEVRVEVSVIAGIRSLSSILHTQKEFVLKSNYPALHALDMFLPAFDPPQEFGRITAVEISEQGQLKKLTEFMEHHRSCSIATLPNTLSPMFLLFPSGLGEFFDRLHVPPAFKDPGYLLIAMLEKVVSQTFPINKISSVPTTSTQIHHGLMRAIGDAPLYQRIAREFGMWPEFIDGAGSMLYSIYNEYSRDSPLLPGNWSFPTTRALWDEDDETYDLITMLERPARESLADLHTSVVAAAEALASGRKRLARRVPWGTKREDVMFIHNNSWFTSDGELPPYIRMREQPVRFFKYGTDFNSPDYKLEEVFPLGGILSVTADALASHTQLTLDMIDIAGAHPCWEVYLHPDTIGVLKCIARKEQNTRSYAGLALLEIARRLFDPDTPFCIGNCPPPEALYPSPYADSVYVDPDSDHGRAKAEWYEEQQRYLSMHDNPHVLFEKCCDALLSKYPHESLNLNSGLWDPMNHDVDAMPALEYRVAETCATDLARMQALPTMYRSYRLFVLLHGAQERPPKNLRKDEIVIEPITSYIFPDQSLESDIKLSSPAWE